MSRARECNIVQALIDFKALIISVSLDHFTFLFRPLVKLGIIGLTRLETLPLCSLKNADDEYESPYTRKVLFVSTMFSPLQILGDNMKTRFDRTNQIKLSEKEIKKCCLYIVSKCQTHFLGLNKNNTIFESHPIFYTM